MEGIADGIDPYLDVQYNARASVPDFEAYARQYRSLSDEAYAALPHAEMTYGNGAGERLDVFGQPSGSGAPVFVFIHGGYWRALSKEDSAFTAAMLHPAGAVVVSLDYALAPAVTLSHIVDQIRRAAAWVHREIGAHGGNPNQIVVGGSSAGGHLAGMLLASGWRDRYGVPSDAITGALALSGLYDVRPLIRTHVNAWMNFDEASMAENSPLLHLPAAGSPRLPELVACHGENETTEFSLQSRRFAQAWTSIGGRSAYQPVPDRDHFSVLIDIADRDSFVGQSALRLLGLG